MIEKLVSICVKPHTVKQFLNELKMKNRISKNQLIKLYDARVVGGWRKDI